MRSANTINPAPSPDASQIETAPHNIEAEQQLLGSILANNKTYDRVISIIQANHFFDPVHGRIFEVADASISSQSSGRINQRLCNTRL